MFWTLLERARRTGRARTRKFLLRLARSRVIFRLARGAPALLMLLGLYLILLGMAAGVSQFSAGFANLVDMAGLDGVAASSAGFVQRQVVGLFGFSPPVMVQAQAALPTPTLDIPADPGLGFIPYQVAVGSQAKAPALPTPTSPPPVAATATPTPVPPRPIPSVTPRSPAPPDHISIPVIGLDAPVVVAPLLTVNIGGQTYEQWDAPGYFAAGWQQGSALLGEPGNTVINGHHNIDGEVFAHLRDLKQGDAITVYSGKIAFHYLVVQVMKLRERDMPLAQRQENARWIMPSSDERLTLVTCWPPLNNTYRLIVVAVPTGP